MVPTPIWMILINFRTVVTACSYKFILKRNVTKLQFLGVFLIVLSIGVTKLTDITATDGVNNIPLNAYLMAMIVSFISTGVSLYQELLFKNGSENFLDQQYWLYFYGMIVTVAAHLIRFLQNEIFAIQTKPKFRLKNISGISLA